MTEDARAYQGKPAYRGLTDDGRHLFIFSQSGIKQVEVCPERGRRALLKLHPRTHTDSTAMGEAFHLAVELCVQSIIDGQGPLGYDDMYVVAADEFDHLMTLDGSRWVKIKTAETIYKHLYGIVGVFGEQVLPTLSPQVVELKLGPYTIHEDDQRVIQLEGTADYLDAVTGLADWKTAGRTWEAREHQRWDVQPTVYTWLLSQSLDVASVDATPWCWHLFYTNGSYERIETTRGPADWAWLKERCLGLAIQIEANLPVWFKNDTSWLCSAKYCDAWDDCKGAALGAPLSSATGHVESSSPHIIDG